MVSEELKTKIWTKLLKKYSILKEVYTEAEETNKELRTNLQPLNEFRASLDHVMAMADAGLLNDDESYILQAEKLSGHINRAFYDICDFVCINYRAMILECLRGYNKDIIRLAMPEYYETLRNEIEAISERISKRRTKKGNNIITSDDISDIDQFEKYKEDFYLLKSIYLQIKNKISEMENAEAVLRKRDEIIAVGNSYNSDTIISVFPVYYSEWLVNLSDIKALPEMDMVSYITNIYDEVVEKEHILKDLEKKAKTKERKSNIFSFLLGYISGILSSITVWFFTKDK